MNFKTRIKAYSHLVFPFVSTSMPNVNIKFIVMQVQTQIMGGYWYYKGCSPIFYVYITRCCAKLERKHKCKRYLNKLHSVPLTYITFHLPHTCALFYTYFTYKYVPSGSIFFSMHLISKMLSTWVAINPYLIACSCPMTRKRCDLRRIKALKVLFCKMYYIKYSLKKSTLLFYSPHVLSWMSKLSSWGPTICLLIASDTSVADDIKHLSLNGW